MHDEWSKELADGRNVRYTYEEVAEGIASVSAQVNGGAIRHVRDNETSPLSREQVEKIFEADIASDA